MSVIRPFLKTVLRVFQCLCNAKFVQGFDLCLTKLPNLRFGFECSTSNCCQDQRIFVLKQHLYNVFLVSLTTQSS